MADTSDVPHLVPPESDSDYDRGTALRSCWNNTKSFFKAISVEPILFMVCWGLGLEQAVIFNFWFEKICLFHFHYSYNVCTNIDPGMFPEEKNNIQQLLIEYHVYAQIIQYFPAIIVVLLLGAWGDTKGRKLPIVVPLLGMFLMPLGTTATAYWFSVPPEYLILCYIPLGITGGNPGVIAGILPYLTIITSDRARTLRFSFLTAVIIFALLSSQFLARTIYEFGNFVAVFGLQALLAAIAVLYAVLRLENRPGSSSSVASDVPPTVLQVLSPARLKKILLVAFRRRTDGKHGNVLGLLAIMGLVVFMNDSYSFFDPYVQKKFSLSLAACEVFDLVGIPFNLIGPLVIAPLLSYRWGVDDHLLIFMAGVSSFLFNILTGIAPVPWILYLAIGLGLFYGQITAVSRSAISKLVAQDELGALFGVVSATETVIPMTSYAMYAAIFFSTPDPGMVFYLNVFLISVICCICLWLMGKSSQQNAQDDIGGDVADDGRGSIQTIDTVT